MTLGKLIKCFGDILLSRNTKQIVWVTCGINHDGTSQGRLLSRPIWRRRAVHLLLVASVAMQTLFKLIERTVRYKNQNTKQVNRMDRHKGIYISLN